MRILAVACLGRLSIVLALLALVAAAFAVSPAAAADMSSAPRAQVTVSQASFDHADADAPVEAGLAHVAHGHGMSRIPIWAGEVVALRSTVAAGFRLRDDRARPGRQDAPPARPPRA